MATYNVTNFADFLGKAATSGNTIVCPEGAVWDLAELDPENTIRTITINSTVTGNGTEIRSHRGDVAIASSVVITALHWINSLFDSTNERNCFLYCTSSSGSAEIKESRVSVQATGGRDFKYNIKLTRCAVTILSPNTWLLFSSGSELTSRYNRIHITAPNATRCNSDAWGLADSEVIIDAPVLTEINNRNRRCTIRGDLAACTKKTGTSSSLGSDFCVINGDDAPNFPASGSDALNIKRVTDLQMRDADYLASIGFVIGSE